MRRGTILLLLVLIRLSKAKKLLEKENSERLQTCGNRMLTIPNGAGDPREMDLPSDQWLVKVILEEIENNTSKIYWEFCLGSFISPRHILTSSQIVVHNDGKWRWAAKSIEEIVPLDKLEKKFRVYVTRNSSLEVEKKYLKRAKKAWILGTRDLIESEIKERRSPMILELSEDVKGVEYPCLVQESEELKNGDETDIYGFREFLDSTNPNKVEGKAQNRTKLYYRHRKILNMTDDNRWIGVEQYKSQEDRGAPMVMNLDGKTTVIGIAATTGLEYKASESYFFDMRFFNTDICSLTGICAPPVSPAPTSVSPGSIEDRVTKDPQIPDPPSPENPESVEEEDEYEDEYEEVEMVRVPIDFGLETSGNRKLNCGFVAFLVAGLLYLI